MISKPTLNQNPINIKRALISVFDKTGVVELAQSLHQHGVEILSTGGTAKTLRGADIPITDVSDYTQFPEIMDGRVKTINPLVEGGILGLRDKHSDDAVANQIQWIDLVVCNLYPFSDTLSRKDCDLALALENVDIGGPTMIRSAAKNVGWVCVAVEPADYGTIAKELGSGEISFETRQKLSSKAFGHTAKYDTVIHNYLKNEDLSDNFSITFEKHLEMRYGENPHQSAASYKVPSNEEPNILNATIHQGKQLSYNNIMDADGALACVREFDDPACVVVKHANPCGVAVGDDLLDVHTRAFNADSLSAFGGIIAFNRTCTKDVAEVIASVFVEIVLAPNFEPEALDIFKKKKNLRVLEIGKFGKRSKKLEIRNVDGGLLVQDTDTKILSKDDLTVVTKAQPSEQDIETALFTWKVLRHAKSNGILIAKDNTTVGLGAGQVSRVEAVHMALRKGGKNVEGGVLASDAFFPFRDSIDAIKDSGIALVIQPGGSVRDQEVIDACNEYGIAMAVTGIRCFKH
ncbi:MAG TPA: bifunctional phosphoribosylaminoimidazolecarboxamide formyltransferase/IMP cyclohydrolase [Candidatus Marinimicrobia bacterium]|jgi:phosphoribosylaminoimidazolecarboxamide formyltransferase/IMP cyclohydrolase|nr:bifunctional phosphoribosylaminoimidazolecarboxamide formyltransferase/inosine monophosphate cyclohydrolase [Candidatus Neomarinimicrobiota bacterium]MDP7330565.1 bifunctional phosphoribosylaminoimidazolecarboxamide formyltransferase/IMP cyclohydrolase [Candidatus Neomarinimicrobiota bacterium]HBN45175.1 bifunctional phosphoribosylaminoimidazolecarboxamide formyltransferase/inosine monophosphate cyclohydrolase [Candidatus Neomarinimicrobiota bacterium]HJL73928.1 bifunctional phosphoribosylami|tara:strand:+ start:3592 stop:5145 length:1554 start_codon:yes stop_codon:yes gene_type:complete